MIRIAFLATVFVLMFPASLLALLLAKACEPRPGTDKPKAGI